MIIVKKCGKTEEEENEEEEEKLSQLLRERKEQREEGFDDHHHLRCSKKVDIQLSCTVSQDFSSPRVFVSIRMGE